MGDPSPEAVGASPEVTAPPPAPPGESPQNRGLSKTRPTAPELHPAGRCLRWAICGVGGPPFGARIGRSGPSVSLRWRSPPAIDRKKIRSPNRNSATADLPLGGDTAKSPSLFAALPNIARPRSRKYPEAVDAAGSLRSSPLTWPTAHLASSDVWSAIGGPSARETRNIRRVHSSARRMSLFRPPR